MGDEKTEEVAGVAVEELRRGSGKRMKRLSGRTENERRRGSEYGRPGMGGGMEDRGLGEWLRESRGLARRDEGGRLRRGSGRERHRVRGSRGREYEDVRLRRGGRGSVRGRGRGASGRGDRRGTDGWGYEGGCGSGGLGATCCSAASRISASGRNSSERR